MLKQERIVSLKKEVLKRNLVIILLLIIFIPAICAGMGYRLGFMISNPKIYAGIYATGSLVDTFKK